MKRFISINFLLFLFLFLIQFPILAQDLSPPRVIKIAGDNKFPPFEYMSSSDVYTGFNVDVMNAISLETGIQIEFHPLPWNEALNELREGKVDMVQGMKYSDQRATTYLFSDSYFTSAQGIFVRKEDSLIHQLKDLSEKTIVVQKDDIANDVVNGIRSVKIIYAENQEKAIQLLLDGKVDAFIGNRITGQYFLQQMGQADKVKIVGNPINSTKYAAVVMPSHQELLKLWNDGLKKIKENGTYTKIENKWFGEYIEPYSWKTIERLLNFLQYSLFVIVIAAVLILWWNFSLKKVVRRRTLELEESDFFKQQLLDCAYSSFITLDHDGNISLMNRHALNILGWSQERIGTNIKETELVSFLPITQIENTLYKGIPYFQQEGTWEKETTRCLDYNVFPIKTKEGEISGAIINFRDVTDYKTMVERMHREDRLRSLGQLVAGVAHEIRNPLTSIYTYTQLLPKKYDLPEFRKAFLEQVPLEMERLNQVVTDLVDFSRPRKSNPVNVVLITLVESILFLFIQKEKETLVDFQIDIPKELIVYGDPGQIKQILINLIMNAFDATPTGKNIKLTAYFAETEVVIEIKDQGSGIPNEITDKIFEPFFTTKRDGVGLGLSICYQLTQENNGSIDFRTSHGDGTTFILRLPGEKESFTDEKHYGIG